MFSQSKNVDMSLNWCHLSRVLMSVSMFQVKCVPCPKSTPQERLDLVSRSGVTNLRLNPSAELNQTKHKVPLIMIVMHLVSFVKIKNVLRV